MRESHQHRPPAPSIQALESDVLEFALSLKASRSGALAADGPGDQHERLTALVSVLEKAQALLQPFKSSAGQRVAVDPFDWPLVFRLQQAQRERALKAGVDLHALSPSGPGGYPSRFIEDLEALIQDANAVADALKPGRGNAHDRSGEGRIKREIADAFVRRCIALGGLPSVSKLSWAEQALSDIYLELGLSAAAAASLASACEPHRDAMPFAPTLKRDGTLQLKSKKFEDLGR